MYPYRDSKAGIHYIKRDFKDGSKSFKPCPQSLESFPRPSQPMFMEMENDWVEGECGGGGQKLFLFSHNLSWLPPLLHQCPSLNHSSPPPTVQTYTSEILSHKVSVAQESYLKILYHIALYHICNTELQRFRMGIMYYRYDTIQDDAIWCNSKCCDSCATLTLSSNTTQLKINNQR